MTWADIISECDGFRAGFVSVFRKYEGKKIEGVKVTARSFALKVGIPQRTFADWLKLADTANSSSPKKVSQREQLLEAIAAEPRTDDELQGLLGFLNQTVTSTRRNLVLDGLVVDSGVRRKTKSGNSAKVWMAKEADEKIVGSVKAEREQERRTAAATVRHPRTFTTDLANKLGEWGPTRVRFYSDRMGEVPSGRVLDMATRLERMMFGLAEMRDALFKGSAAHRLLGVPATASVEECRTAYRKLARETHPDAGGDPDAFREVREAYANVTASVDDELSALRSKRA